MTKREKNIYLLMFCILMLFIGWNWYLSWNTYRLKNELSDAHDLIFRAYHREKLILEDIDELQTRLMDLEKANADLQTELARGEEEVLYIQHNNLKHDNEPAPDLEITEK
ncbi:MAG: hypothetical protein JW860_06070 [Sedimentisphaerales bacterium]|nr:hypothetical protein [Sedimentisphaerales bacterium]